MNITEQIAASIYDSISKDCSEGASKTQELIEKAVGEGIPIEEIIRDGLIAGMGPVSRDFKINKIYVPEVLIASHTFKSGIEVLKPHAVGDREEYKEPAVIGTVKGDLHCLGTNLVAMMLEADGYQVHNLGVDVSPSEFVAASEQYNAHLVCISSLMTTTMLNMKHTCEAFRAANLYDKVKILIGGAPVTERWAEECGAHGYADSCFSAVQAANRLLEK